MWIYKGEELKEIPEGYIGMVYLITNHVNGKQYIGKKQFHFSRTKTIKGKKKKTITESDWKNYWSSSNKLKEDVELYGVINFTREIINLCKTKSEMTYFEAKLQFKYDVLLNQEKWYNEWISCKIRSSHLNKKKI